jgi:PST family polysaccharide transporter
LEPVPLDFRKVAETVPVLVEPPPPAPLSATSTRELDRNLLRGIAWTGGIKTAAQALSWVSTLVVARLLAPADYGVVGMAMVYVGLVQLVNEFGLSAAVVQRRDLTDDQIAKLGGLSVVFGGALAMISLAAAPLVGRFFESPEVTGVVMLLSVTFLSSAFQVLPRSLMTRELDFKRLAIIDGVEAITVTAVTLTIALLGGRYWSLVVGSVAGRTVSTVLALVLRRHRLAWPFPLTTIRDAVRFGSHIAASSIAWYVFRNADMTIVGRQIGTLALGAYTVGWNLASMPVDRISALLARATPAIFARVQDDPAALRRYVLSLTEAIAILIVPNAVGLALVADDFVVVVLGERWIPAIAPLRLLALAAVFRSAIPLLNQVLVATGRSRENMRGTTGIAITLPIFFLLSAYWGPTGVAAVWLFGFPLVSYVFYMRAGLDACELSSISYARAFWPALKPGLVMTAGVLATHYALPNASPLVRLMVEVVVGAALYIGVLYLTQGRRIFEFIRTLRGTA